MTRRAPIPELGLGAHGSTMTMRAVVVDVDLGDSHRNPTAPPSIAASERQSGGWLVSG